jgi:UDP-N-acetylglucosamine--N-acetylmuramyl-(pentapeptide) pyrophosphoryl-undecaprenol N-acetylglucosamine transferase
VRVILTGGGTGGHVYPALAIGEALAEDPDFAPLELLFIGTREGLEAQIVPKAGIPIAYVPAAPLTRALSPALFVTVGANAAGFVEALAAVQGFRPDAAIATGGYVAFPVIAAVRALRALRVNRARIAFLEPNSVAGLTNRLLSPIVDERWLAHPPHDRALGANEILTGTPVRASLRRPMTPEKGRTDLGLGATLTTIVVMGGSQGASSLNAATLEMIANCHLPPEWQVLLISGERDYDRVRAAKEESPARARVHVLPYLDDPRAAYAAADVMVARAGASTLGELAATRTAAILVPYPHATRDHQALNAEAARRLGTARIVPDAPLTGDRLFRELTSVLYPTTLAQMREALGAAERGDAAAAIRARVKRWLPKNAPNP